MKTEDLDKANAKLKEIKELKTKLKNIVGYKEKTQILFQQYNTSEPNGNVSTVEQNEYTGLDAQIQTILLATKQTLISVFEREISKLEKEFDNI